MLDPTRPRLLVLLAVAVLFLAFLVFDRWASSGPVERLEAIKAKVRSDFPDAPQLSTDDLIEVLERSRSQASERPMLLDVRRSEEYAVSHLEGAIHVDPDDPFASLPRDLDPATPIVAYCSVGYRSSRLVEELRAAGFSRVENLEGSIFEWAAKGYPLVDAAGAVEVVHPYSRAWAWLVDEEHRAYVPRAAAAGAAQGPVETSEEPVAFEEVAFEEAAFEEGGAELAELYTRAGVEGTFVLLVPGREGVADRWLVHDGERARQRFRPASTFKIPNSLICLEEGIATGPDFALPWDGVERPIRPWNRDHDLRSAFRYSVLWFYQEMARRLGQERMDAWVARLDYGNGNTGGGVDRFWLDGDLRISAEEQVRFLRRLEAGELPFSVDTQQAVREIMVLDETEAHVLWAKTGWALGRPLDSDSTEGEPDVAWLVGWVERKAPPREGEVAFFAHNISFRDRSKAEHRTELAKATLRRLGWL